MTKSVLDDIPGLGPTRKKRLTKELGGVRAVKQAPLEQLQALPWLPDAVTQAVHDKIHKATGRRSEEHTSELQSLMRISYAVFCLKKKKHTNEYTNEPYD